MSQSQSSQSRSQTSQTQSQTSGSDSSSDSSTGSSSKGRDTTAEVSIGGGESSHIVSPIPLSDDEAVPMETEAVGQAHVGDADSESDTTDVEPRELSGIGDDLEELATASSPIPPSVEAMVESGDDKDEGTSRQPEDAEEVEDVAPGNDEVHLGPDHGPGDDAAPPARGTTYEIIEGAPALRPGSYNWVNKEIRDIKPFFQSRVALDEFLAKYSLSDSIHPGRMCVVRPSADSRLYHHFEHDGVRRSFYMYSTMFERLHMRLPFSAFQCDVMTFMRVAPTQLHPVSWGYIRTFEILCEFLGAEPNVGVFFSLFTAKNFSAGGIISLGARPGKKLFRSFDDSYKGFKDKWFRVCEATGCRLFYYLGGYVPTFSLNWHDTPKGAPRPSRNELDEDSQRLWDLLEAVSGRDEREAPWCKKIIECYHKRDYLGVQYEFRTTLAA